MSTPISKPFTLNYKPFPDWFNTEIALKFPFFQNKINGFNFYKVLSRLTKLTGKSSIGLEEFLGHFCIIYNETGGTFQPSRERGGQEYMFNTVMPNGHSKLSYNSAPNNRLAGNQLKAMGAITSSADVLMWNGHVYPKLAPINVKAAAEKCDFYRFRGYGFNQLTWRLNYLNCVQPHLPKPMDEYSVTEFENVLLDFDLASMVFYTFNHRNTQAINAMNSLANGDWQPYAKMVSGGAKWYMDLYGNRYHTLLQKMNLLTIRDSIIDFDGYALSKPQVTKIQNTIIAFGNTTAANIINTHGGADGSWGGNTATAFEMLGNPLNTYGV